MKSLWFSYVNMSYTVFYNAKITNTVLFNTYLLSSYIIFTCIFTYMRGWTGVGFSPSRPLPSLFRSLSPSSLLGATRAQNFTFSLPPIFLLSPSSSPSSLFSLPLFSTSLLPCPPPHI